MIQTTVYNKTKLKTLVPGLLWSKNQLSKSLFLREKKCKRFFIIKIAVMAYYIAAAKPNP